MNLSGSLLIWTLDQMPTEFYQKLENTYVGCVSWEGPDTWGDYYYIKSKEDYSMGLLAKVRQHPMYESDFYTDDGEFIVVFKFTDEQKKTLIKPFLDGAYSKMDRDYVNKYFKSTSPTGATSTNWQILNKDEALRAHWERELNVTPYIRIFIPEDAEVWSRIKKENEILGYETFIKNQEEVLESV